MCRTNGEAQEGDMVASQLEKRPQAMLHKVGKSWELGSSGGHLGCGEPGREAVQRRPG